VGKANGDKFYSSVLSSIHVGNPFQTFYLSALVALALVHHAAIAMPHIPHDMHADCSSR